MGGESRGFEWNIFIYRLVNEQIFSTLIRKIDPPTKIPFDKEFHKIQKRSLIKIILFGLLLIAANIFAFVYFKKENLFEAMNLPRVCTDEQIERAFQFQQKQLQVMSKGFYQQQVQLKERQLAEIKDILKNPARRMIYDKYGIAESQYAYFLTPQFTMQQILQTGISYLILLLVSIAGTGQQEKSIIKWQVLLIINFFLIEVHLLQSDSSKADFVDAVFPQLTVQHRLIIVKFLLIPVQIIVGYISSKLTPNRVRHMQSKILFLKDGIYSQLKVVSNNMVINSQNPYLPENATTIPQDQLIKSSKEFEESVISQMTLLEETNDIITLQNKKNENKWDIGSLVKTLVICYIFYEQFNK